MKFYENKKNLLGFLITALIIFAIIGQYWYFHPTHSNYNDRFIIGKSVNQIIERYGEFDIVFYKDLSSTVISQCGYMVEPNEVGFMGTSWPKYYMITFKDGKAVHVEIETGNWGG